MPRLARLDVLGVLHHIMARGIDRAKIFREHEEDFQGTTIVLSAGGEEDGLSRKGNGPVSWCEHCGRRSSCEFRGFA